MHQFQQETQVFLRKGNTCKMLKIKSYYSKPILEMSPVFSAL